MPWSPGSKLHLETCWNTLETYALNAREDVLNHEKRPIKAIALVYVPVARDMPYAPAGAHY